MTWAPYCAWYVGCPAAGKTYLALEHVREDYRATGRPVLLVDSTEAANFDGVRRAQSAEDALIALYTGDAAEIAWTPREPEEVEALARALRAGGRLHVLVDEAAFWLSSSRGRGGALLRLLRAYRHAELSLHLTTQHLSGDVPQEALSCAPILYVFRTTSGPALKVLEERYGQSPMEIETLPQYEFRKIELGFQTIGS